MKIRIFVTFFISVLLVACTTATPITLPTAAIPFVSSATPTQTSAPTSTLTPSATLTPTGMPTLEATTTSLPQASPMLERVAQTGGSICGITVVGDLAFVGMGPRVGVIDISQRENPRLVSQSELLPGLVTLVIQISSEPDPLLLVNAGKYLVMVDITDPENIYPIQELELTGAIGAMVWDDRATILYAGGAIYKAPMSLGYDGFVSAVKLTQGNTLELINTVRMPAQVLSLALGVGSLFAGAEGASVGEELTTGLYHIPLNSSGGVSTPRRVIDSGPEDPLTPVSLQVIGDRLYLGYRSIDAYDITDPDQPLRIWRNYAGIVVKGFNVVGEQVIAFGWTILTELTLDTIPAAEPILGQPLGIIASITAMHDGDFLVAFNDLEIYDAADPQAPQLVGVFQTPVIHAFDAAVNENAVYVVDSGIGASNSQAILRAFSLPDLTPLGQVNTEISPWYSLVGITLEGNRAYLAAEDGLWAYDISNLGLVLVGKVEIGDEQLEAILAIRQGERRLLVAMQRTEDKFNVLRVYDLTDLQEPVQLGEPLTLAQGWGTQMTWNGSAIYILLEGSYFSGGDLLYVVDFDNDLLELRGSLELAGYTTHMAVNNDLIILSGTSDSMDQSTIAVAQSEPLRLMSTRTLPEEEMGVAIIGDKALVVVGSDWGGAAQLLMFDIQDPTNPRQVEAMDIAVSQHYSVTILYASPLIILANGAGGVEVLDYGG